MRKFISIALSIVMIISAVVGFDFSAMAEGPVAIVSSGGEQQNYTSFEDAWTAAQGKTATILLQKNTTVNDMLLGNDEGNNITINLGTYTLQCVLLELEAGTYNFVATTGGISATYESLAGIVIGFSSPSNVTINGGIYSGAHGAISFSDSVVTLNSGTFKAGTEYSIDGDISSALPQGYVFCSLDGRAVVATHQYKETTIDQSVTVTKCTHPNQAYKVADNIHTKNCFDCDTELENATPCIFNSVVTQPTCLEAGYTTHTCICSNSYVDSEVPATGHSYGSWTHNDGAKTHSKVCVSGDDTITESCTFSEVVTEPTCVEKGYTTYTCSFCGYSYKDKYVNETGNHTLNSFKDNEVPSTCIAEGSYDAVTVCEVCNTEISRKTITIPKSGHKAGGYVSNGDSTHSPSCSVCNQKLDTSVENCTYNVRTVAPTCTARGYDIHTCTACGSTYKDNYVNKIAHTPVTDKAIAATCTRSGKTAGSHCSVCKAVIVAQKTVAAKGHSYDGGVVTKAPTSKASGVMTYTCKVCKAKKTSSISKLATVSISSVSAKSKAFRVSWKKKSSATGYQIQYSTSSKMAGPKTVTITKNSTVSKTITKLKSKKKYYVRIRTYRTIRGKKYYSSWSTKKSVITKK